MWNFLKRLFSNSCIGTHVALFQSRRSENEKLWTKKGNHWNNDGPIVSFRGTAVKFVKYLSIDLGGIVICLLINRVLRTPGPILCTLCSNSQMIRTLPHHPFRCVVLLSIWSPSLSLPQSFLFESYLLSLLLPPSTLLIDWLLCTIDNPLYCSQWRTPTKTLSIHISAILCLR